MSYYHSGTSPTGGGGQQHWGSTDVRASAAGAKDVDAADRRYAPQSSHDGYGPGRSHGGSGNMGMRGRYEQAAARQAGGDARYRHEQQARPIGNQTYNYGGGTAAPPQQQYQHSQQSQQPQYASYSGGRVAASSANAKNNMSEYDAQQSKLASQNAHRNYQLRQSNRNQTVQHEGGANGAGLGANGGGGGAENSSSIMEEALRTSHAYGRLGKPPSPSQSQVQQQPQQQHAQLQQPSAQSQHRNQPRQCAQPQHFAPRQSSQHQQHQLATPQRAPQSSSSSPRHQRRPSPTNSVYSDPEPVLEMDDDDPSVSQPLHVGGGGGMHGRGMAADQVEQYAAQAQAQAQHMHQAQAQQMHLTQPGRDPPGNGAHYGTPSRSNVAKGYGKHHHHHHSAQDDVTATPTPSTMTDQTKTTATMSMSMSTAVGGGAEAMSMPPYRQHQPHPHPQQHPQQRRPQGSPQRRRPSHPQQSQQPQQQWPAQPRQEQQQQQQQEYFDQRPQQQMQETTTSSGNRSKKSHIQWDEGVFRSPEKRGSVGGGGDGGRRGDGCGEDISTAASGHSQFRSRFFRAAAVAAHRDGKIQVDGVTTADSGAGASTSGDGPGAAPARQQMPVAPQPSSSPRAPAVGNFHTSAPISPRNNINTSMSTDAGVVHEAPRQMVGRVERADDSPAIAAPSPMRVPMRRAIDPEPSPSPQRRALQPPEQHHVTFQAPHNGPQSILRSPTRSPARTKSSSEAGASSLHQHMLNQNAIRRTGSYSTSGSTDKSSVARLVAKLNSVKRDDPASALAAIDAIIKSESFSVGGGSGTQDDDVEIENADEIGAATSEINEMKANLETTAEVMDKPANHAMQPISHDPPAAQPLFPDVPIGNQNAIAPTTSPRTDEEEIKSLVGSSEDESDDEDGSFASTVSSITNPTYLGNFKARQGSDNGGLMIQHWQQQQQQMTAPPQQSMNSGENQGAGLPPLAPQMRPFPASGSQPSHPAAAPTPEASPGRMIMTPPKVTRTKADPSSADMPSSRDPTGQELISPVISPAGSFAATTPKSPGEESRTSPIARMRAAAEKQDKRQQSRDNVHRAVASSRDALDALDEQLQQQRQRQVDSGLANGYSRDALDALDEQQARTANTSRNDGDTPAWAREPPRKSSSDRAFDAAAQKYLSSATSPLVRSVSSRPANAGPSRSPKWQSSTTSSSRNDRNTFRSSPSRSFEDPYIDQTKAVADAFAGVDISFEEDGQKDGHNEYGSRSPGSGGGLTEENMNKFDSLHGASRSRYAQSDIGVGRFYAYDDTAAKSPLDIFYERRASASPTKTPAALQKMKARFGPNYSASGEALEVSPKSNRREISETTSDFFPSMELEKGKVNSGSFDAEMDAILKEFDERPKIAGGGKTDKPEKQKGRSSKRFLPKRLFRNPRASKAAADF